MGIVSVFRVLGSLEGTGRDTRAVVEGTGRGAVVVAAVLAVGIDASMKVVIAALGSEKVSSNFLILN